MFSPLEQFDVIPLIFFSIGNYDITFFNIFLPLLLIIFVLFIIESFYINYKLIPSNI